MDPSNFDALTRVLTAARSRRGALAAVLGGTLGLLGLAETIAKKMGTPVHGEGKQQKTKKSCPPCKKRKKGKCKGKKPDDTACPGGTCQRGRCVAAATPACGAGGPCHVFLSSTVYTGELGGLSGADAKCQGLAVAAGLPGTYRAWLSDSTGSASSRFVPSSGLYRLVNGTTIAANFADLTDGTLLAPINVTETGGGIGSTDLTWTFTRINGNLGGQQHEHCENWTTGDVAADGGDFGSGNRSNSYWTQYGWSRCNQRYHLYCFQQR